MSNVFILEAQQSTWRYSSLIAAEPAPSNRSTLVLDNSSGETVWLTGLEIVGQSEGATYNVLNKGTDSLELISNSSEAIAAHRFAEDATLPAGGNIQLYYNGLGWDVLEAGGIVEIGSDIEGEAPGGVLFADQNGKLAQNAPAFYFDPIYKTLKLWDKNYTGLFAAGITTSFLSLGKKAVDRYALPADQHLFAAEIVLPLTISGSNKWYVGQRTNLDLQGNPVAPLIMGHMLHISTNALFPTGVSTIYGHWTSVDIGAPVTETVAGYFHAFPGGAGAGGAGTVVGVRGIAGMGHNANSDIAMAGDFWISSSLSSPSLTNLAVAIRARMTNMPGLTATVGRLLSLTDTFNNTGIVENSSYIYADTTFDIGTVTKYFIKSLSTSPSELAGSLALPSLVVNLAAAATIGIKIKLAAAQSANAIEVQPSGSATPVFAVDADGDVTMKNAGAINWPDMAAYVEASTAFGMTLRTNGSMQLTSANGLFLVSKAFSSGGRFGAMISRPSQITADVDNYDFGGHVGMLMLLTSDTSRSITGATMGGAAPTDGEWHFFINTGAFNILFPNDHGGSTAAHRWLVDGGGTLTLGPNKVALMIYDGNVSRWRSFLLN